MMSQLSDKYCEAMVKKVEDTLVTFFLHALSFECTSKLYIAFLN